MRLFVSVCLIISSWGVAHAGDWEWELSPYIWASAVTLNVSVNDMEVAGVEVAFKDLIDKADIGGLIHFEGQRGRGGFFIELVYLDLSDDNTITGAPLVPDGTITKSGLQQLIAEVGGFYQVHGDDSGLEVLFGARLFDLSVDVTYDFPVDPDYALASNQSLVDGFIGMRYQSAFAERWVWWLRGDAGTGGTDLSWQGVAGVGLKLGKDRDDTLWFGYRHLEFDDDAEDAGITDTEIVFSGPMFGYTFSF